MPPRQIQTAYDAPLSDVSAAGTREAIFAAMYGYLTEDLGRNPDWSRQRAIAESERSPASRACDDLERIGITLAGKKILELGAGLGSFTVELTRRGAKVTAVEPGKAWRNIAGIQLAESGSGQILGAVGEALPFASDTFDLIVSLQVLEHVQNPPKVISELYRVLKPGGQVFLAYENYLGFREPHYDVAWLPLLPKPLGALYLKMRGRNPRFLLESVTYTTFPAVRGEMLRTGFVCTRKEGLRARLNSGGGKWAMLRSLPGGRSGIVLNLLFAADFARRLFVTYTEEFMSKPRTESARRS